MLRPVPADKAYKKHRFISAENYSQYSDEEIVQKILDGQTPLFEVIMRRYNQRLFRIQRAYISDEEAIKDTLQRTYLKAYQKLNQFRGDAKFSTWIIRIAINEALKHINSNKKYTRLYPSGDEKPKNIQTVDTEYTPEEQAIQDDLQHLLESAVNQLPPKYRSVYMMRELEQISTRETAECLELSESNVKVRLHRAKQMVREELERKVTNVDIFRFLGERCDRLVFCVMHKINRQESKEK